MSKKTTYEERLALCYGVSPRSAARICGIIADAGLELVEKDKAMTVAEMIDRLKRLGYTVSLGSSK